MQDSWLNRLEIQLVCGDLFEQAPDAVMCPTRDDLAPYGAISAKATRIGGRALEDLLNKKYQTFEITPMVLGSSAAVDVSSIEAFHFRWLVTVALWQHESQYTANLFNASYTSAIRMAAERQCHSLALPIMAYDGNLPMACEGWSKALAELGALPVTRRWPLETLLVCSTSEKNLEAFEQATYRLYRSGC